MEHPPTPHAPQEQWWNQQKPNSEQSFYVPPGTEQPWRQQEAVQYDASPEVAGAKDNPFAEIVDTHQALFESIDTTGRATVPQPNVFAIPGSGQSPVIERSITYDAIADSLGGWKLHLNIDLGNPLHVQTTQNLLEAMRDAGQVANFKIGHAGDQVGKSATVFVGHCEKAKLSASIINRLLDGILRPPEGDAIIEDVAVADNVMGRFDVGGKVDSEFNQYGPEGIPLLKEDVGSSVFGDTDHSTRDSNILRAKEVLVRRYGTFFTGSNPSDS